MNDKDLAAFLNLTDDEAAQIIPGLSADRRAAFERMADVCADLNLGVIPPGVIVCRERGRQPRRRRPRPV